MKSVTQVREESLATARALGFETNENLGFLESGLSVRPLAEILDRTLALFALVAVSYGFSRVKAREWLVAEKLMSALTDEEIDFLDGTAVAESDAAAYQWRVEALWSLTWSAGLHDELSWAERCPNDFVSRLPDIKSGESTDHFRGLALGKPDDLVLGQLDLAYCLDWAARDGELRSKPGATAIPPQVIRERRRGLEWVLSRGGWDELSLDT